MMRIHCGGRVNELEFFWFDDRYICFLFLRVHKLCSEIAIDNQPELELFNDKFHSLFASNLREIERNKKKFANLKNKDN